ncbi:hypothetical protein SK128_007040 [Halocaridina rubra]|uniref:Uncharacterized protein n=1 Tax=Halocaridina rubra TaxID=373956 RepID=A0AAN9ACE7_HALRR
MYVYINQDPLIRGLRFPMCSTDAKGERSTSMYYKVYLTAVKERQFRGLQTSLESSAQFSVVRARSIVQVNVGEIVVGDVCQTSDDREYTKI